MAKEFKSLVTQEEHDAIAKLYEAVIDLITVHNEAVTKRKEDRVEMSPKQGVHYRMYTDFIRDVQDLVYGLMTVDTAGIKALDEHVKESGTSYTELFLRQMVMDAQK